jgi:lipopolysaccharide/colanic/teichoic acid biosynthesis glycosyltransferase
MAAGSVVLLVLGLYGLWMVRASTGGVLALFAGITTCVTLVMLMAGPVGLRYRISLSGLLFIGAGAMLTRLRASALAKRALDVTLSGAGLVASLPVWVAVASLVKLEDGGPIFYGQDRVGENGCIFRVLKFRSMVPDAEATVGALQASAHDPRVTRVGRWLRATAADELPQLWNIFRGDMSFVGPRALRPGEIEVGGEGRLVQLEEVPGFADRCRVRPGLTGVAQIYAPRDIPRRHKFQYDKLYIRKRSFWLDVRLILLSFWITFRGTWEVRGQKF